MKSVGGDLLQGVPEGPPLEKVEVLALGPPLEVVLGPPLEVLVGLMMEDAARVELELDLEGGQQVQAWWDQLLVASFGKAL